MKAYFEDLRQKIVTAIRRGMPKAQTARLLWVLATSPRRGQIVIIDNLSTHKTDTVRELVEQRRCELLYLPPYTPRT
jgi:transposase